MAGGAGTELPSAASIISVFSINRPGLNITDGKLCGDFGSVPGVGGTTAAPAAVSVEAAAAVGSIAVASGAAAACSAIALAASGKTL